MLRLGYDWYNCDVNFSEVCIKHVSLHLRSASVCSCLFRQLFSHLFETAIQIKTDSKLPLEKNLNLSFKLCKLRFSNYVNKLVTCCSGCSCGPTVREVVLVAKRSPLQSPGPRERNVGGVGEATVLSPPTTFTAEVPLRKALNPQLLPGHRWSGSPLLQWLSVHCVSVCSPMVKSRADIPLRG